MSTRNFKARAKFFTGDQSLTTRAVFVDTVKGTIMVWDGQHYTLAHALSDRAIKRILKQARA